MEWIPSNVTRRRGRARRRWRDELEAYIRPRAVVELNRIKWKLGRVPKPCNGIIMAEKFKN